MSIYKFLMPPRYDDLEKNRVANLMNLILLFNGAFIVLLLITFLAFGFLEVRNIAPILVSLILYGAFYLLLKKGYVNLSAILFVIVSYLIDTIVVIIYGGVHTPFLFLYFVTIVIASAVLREVYAIFIYALVMLTSVAMFFAEKMEILPLLKTPYSIEFTPLIIMGTNLIIMVGIIYLSNRSFRQALALYEDELDTRRNAEKEIRQLNLELEQRVLERTAELASVNKELESFSYSVSHDLRAPLRTISGFSTIVLENTRENIGDENVGYLIKIENATRKMASIIDGLLELSKITRGNIRTDTVNLSEMATEIANGLSSREAKQEVEINISEGLYAQGDERLLRILLINLINNAWKFTKDQEKVQLDFSLIEKNGQRIYFVKDNGVGFDSVDAQKLFTPFHRLHPESEFEGSGIGLATCKKIIERHGGELWAEAEMGKGATFYFTLSIPKEELILKNEYNSRMPSNPA